MKNWLRKHIIFLGVMILFPSAVYGQGKILAETTKSAFQWGIGLAATFAAIAFIFGAAQYMLSFDKPDQRKDGISRMLSATLGLILCGASILILNTVNPKIAKLDFGEPIGKQVTGIYYSNGNDDEDVAASFSLPDSQAVTEAGYGNLRYFCEDHDEALPPAPAIVWFYPEKNFIDTDPIYKNTEVELLNCGEILAIRGKSLKIAYQQAGIYFFMEDNCEGYRSEKFDFSLTLPNPFYGKAKSLLVNNYSGGTPKNWYGVILQESERATESGKCTDPFYYPMHINNSNCYSIKNITPHSATIFDVAKPAFTRPISTSMSGNGLTVYSKPWGWKARSFAGYHELFIKDDSPTKKNRSWELSLNAEAAEFDYKSCSWFGEDCETEAYKKKCSNFAQCPGSVRIRGDFLAVMSTDQDYGNRGSSSQSTSNCQIFYGDIHTVKEQEFIGEGNRIKSIKLIPIIK